MDWFARMSEQPVDLKDLEAVMAVWENHVEGFVYDDGEVWAVASQLADWRAKHWEGG